MQDSIICAEKNKKSFRLWREKETRAEAGIYYYVSDTVRLSGIDFGKQKVGRTFNFYKQDMIEITKKFKKQ